MSFEGYTVEETQQSSNTREMMNCTPCTAFKNIDFEAEVSTARRDVHQSPSPSPFNRLPTELISRIFRSIDSWGVILPPDFTQLPWVLGRVCSRWRSLSRAQLFLWGSPGILEPTHKNITRAIDILPPGVLIDFTQELCQGETIKRWAPYLGRCRNLEFSGDLDQYEELWANLPQDAFVNLKSVDFSLEDSEARISAPPLDPEAFWASTAAQWAMARNLHDAKFYISSDIPEASTLFSSIPLPWHQLETIKVTMESDTFNNVEVLWMYLRQCRALTRLEIDVSLAECRFPGMDLAASIELPELRTLKIEGISSHILLPQHIWRNLAHLSIFSTSTGEIEACPNDVQRILELCCTNLEELVIWDPFDCAGCESFPLASTGSARLQFPLLRSLQVSTLDITRTLSWKLDVSLINAPNLRDLRFDGLPSNLLDATRAFGTSLSHVEFYGLIVKPDEVSPEFHREVLSTLAPTARFIDWTRTQTASS